MTETKGDCISRKALLADFKERNIWSKDIVEAINNAPAVETEWVKKEDVINLLKKWAGGYYYIELPTDEALKEVEQLTTLKPKEDCKDGSNHV